MKNLPFSRSKQQGFTLVELLLVLGVLALIAITAFIIYPSVQAGTQANSEAANVTTITASVKNLFGSAGNYSGLAAAGSFNGCPAFLYPSDMLQGVDPATVTSAAACTPTNVWGGSVTLASGGTNGSEFVIAYTIPNAPQACEKFIADVAANYDVVGVGSATDASIKPSGGAILPAGIVTACTATASPVIYFTSK